ncbi:hypothetical protein AXF42_Ash019602 [Apostasia shenzhenica]|uniref:RRM domain-containing protein n=1 Tax=Apostasia shenzhenica TaxID=1088818 RepID=A0A2I0A3G2_9ASPA|nr:hypothetical protein AXF42_Ash019602 [Apostasia shenzhenica]
MGIIMEIHLSFYTYGPDLTVVCGRRSEGHESTADPALQWVLQVRTVKVSNVSHIATEQEIKEFFSFSGDIDHVELKSFDEWSRVAYVTFRDSQGAETAILLSQYQESKPAATSKSAVRKVEDVVTTMLAKGYALGKGAVSRAKTFDEKHRITSTAAAKVVSFDKKIGFSEKIDAGASAVGGKVRQVDDRFRVSEKSKSAFSAAEQKVSSAGSAMMKNRYVFTGVSFVTGAFSKVGKAAGDVGSKAKEKAAAEQMKRGII